MSPAQEETTATTTAAAAAAADDDDPYIWLEDVESEESLNFARAANEDSLQKLGHPENSGASYERILKVLESDDRIPHVSKYGNAATSTIAEGGEGDAADAGDAVLYNFWKDAQNRRGIWRKTTMSSYTSSNNEETQWTTVLDIDALGAKDGVPWVYGGNSPLPRSRDDAQADTPKTQQQVLRSLVSLSRGGSDAKHVREFDLQAMDFVSDMDSGSEAAFDLPKEAKTRCSYKSRDVVLVATDFGEGTDSLTDSGYPRTVREWVRGTDLKDAPVVFEGEKTDVSVSQYISDERTHGGDIYEVQSRSMTFYTSRYWMRKLQPEHLLAVDNPKRLAIAPPPDFVQLDLQEDAASASLLGNLILISLRSNWQPRGGDGGNGPTYKRGSVIYTNTDQFLAHGAAACDFEILFEPTERTAYEYWTATQNYLILSTMDNVKSKLEFFKIQSSSQDSSSSKTTTLTPVDGGGATASVGRIRECHCSPMDPYDGSDLFWFTKSDYITPSSLYLADASLVEKQHHSSNNEIGEVDNDVFIVDKLKSLPPQFDADNLVVQQRTAISKDGTEIPYFIVMHKDVVLNGKNPTLLYGYGGFEVSLGPHYIAVTGLAWLERSGVYVEGASVFILCAFFFYVWLSLVSNSLLHKQTNMKRHRSQHSWRGRVWSRLASSGLAR
jgi:prolyl oligopeptidase